jgi:hypothetical protein
VEALQFETREMYLACDAEGDSDPHLASDVENGPVRLQA